MNEQLLVGAPPGSIGRSDSGWVDSTIFVDWLHHFAHSVGCTPKEPHILILDGHHFHKTLEAVLPPHCSHKMQLLDRTDINV